MLSDYYYTLCLISCSSHGFIFYQLFLKPFGKILSNSERIRKGTLLLLCTKHMDLCEKGVWLYIYTRKLLCLIFYMWPKVLQVHIHVIFWKSLSFNFENSPQGFFFSFTCSPTYYANIWVSHAWYIIGPNVIDWHNSGHWCNFLLKPMIMNMIFY